MSIVVVTILVIMAVVFMYADDMVDAYTPERFVSQSTPQRQKRKEMDGPQPLPEQELAVLK